MNIEKWQKKTHHKTSWVTSQNLLFLDRSKKSETIKKNWCEAKRKFWNYYYSINDKKKIFSENIVVMHIYIYKI